MRPGSTPQRRQALRRASTDAERALWRLLRSRQLEGYKFRRQHAVGPYILDFYCAESRLAVEVDGSQHYTADGLADDAVRTESLRSAGIEVMRLPNSDVLTNAEGVIPMLLRTLEDPR